jgi:hypothetical protein
MHGSHRKGCRMQCAVPKWNGNQYLRILPEISPHLLVGCCPPLNNATLAFLEKSLKLYKHVFFFLFVVRHSPRVVDSCYACEILHEPHTCAVPNMIGMKTRGVPEAHASRPGEPLSHCLRWECAGKSYFVWYDRLFSEDERICMVLCDFLSFNLQCSRTTKFDLEHLLSLPSCSLNSSSKLIPQFFIACHFVL